MVIFLDWHVVLILFSLLQLVVSALDCLEPTRFARLYCVCCFEEIINNSIYADNVSLISGERYYFLLCLGSWHFSVPLDASLLINVFKS